MKMMFLLDNSDLDNAKSMSIIVTKGSLDWIVKMVRGPVMPQKRSRYITSASRDAALHSDHANVDSLGKCRAESWWPGDRNTRLMPP